MLHQDLPSLPLSQMALFLDVDGTLLDIAPTPSEVVVGDGLKELLANLYRQNGGAVALVSGRAIADLDHLFAPLRLPAAGQHGAEWRIGPNDAPERLTVLPEPLRQQAVALAQRHPGMLVEDKGGAVALHVRARPELTEEIAEALADMVRFHPEFEVLGGKAVFEVRRRGVHKGAAVANLLEHPPFAGRTPVYLGDDTTDLDAIELVNARHGHGLLIAPSGPLRCPADVHRWLGALLDDRPAGCA
ncbi:MAG TPA: trehalose-phosphatase [Geminicoccus sp.]|uniref:trehalose-phosphatase n=1 Tax=Geminicoccus sp. TaxID=2024832 RepID=UPI002E326F53|nr:trehalose-phosphatase [Geminicoccus sp.]HEX2525496.1 trehalose-phosphatase [Geminicoccus sp.]